MNRVFLVSIVAGGSVFLLFAALYRTTGWPVVWFAVVAGSLVSAGLYLGLSVAGRTGGGGVARALFVLIGLLMGAVGFVGLVIPPARPPHWAAWVAIACSVCYLAAAAAPSLWRRR